MLEISFFHRSSHEQIELASTSVDFFNGNLNGQHIESGTNPVFAAIAFTTSTDQNQITISNQGNRLVLPWHGKDLQRGQTTTVDLPVQVRRGEAVIEIRDSNGFIHAGRSFKTISRPRSGSGQPFVDARLLGQSPSSGTLARWLEALGALERSASGSDQLLQNTAQAVCEPGGMNGAILIFREGGEWKIKANHLPNPELGVAFSRDLIEKVAEQRQTHYHDASEDLEASSRSRADSVIAAPVFGDGDEVVGIVYGIRSLCGDNLRRGVRPLEALWIQLLAESVSGSLLRMRAEAEAARNRVMLEQVFSDKVVDQLLTDKTILESHDREVTTLFADLRGYSKLSEHLGPKATHELLAEVLELLTDCTRSEEGVIIDYYGDGLAAMWNAPIEQTDHPLRACRAALAMQNGLDAISQRWKSKIRAPLRLGIGINTGVSQVGNSGTKTRLKYGPRGRVVIVASRLESATRRTKAGILLGSETKRRLPPSAVTRRVCRAKLPGIDEALELYELIAFGSQTVEKDLLRRIDIYEQALALTESGNLDEAEALLAGLQNANGAAKPADFLNDQIQLVEERKGGNTDFVDLTNIKT